MRAGTLSLQRVRVGACLGFEAAQAALGEEIPVDELASCLIAAGPEAVARALAACGRAVAGSQAPAPIHALESWILCPCARHLEVCRETCRRTQFPDAAAEIGALGVSALEAPAEAGLRLAEARSIAVEGLENRLYLTQSNVRFEDHVDEEIRAWVGSWALGTADLVRSWSLKAEAGHYHEDYLVPLLESARAAGDLDEAAAAQAHLAHFHYRYFHHLDLAIEHGRQAAEGLRSRSRPDLLGLALYAIAASNEALREDDRPPPAGVVLSSFEEERSLMEEAARLLEESEMPMVGYCAGEARVSLARYAHDLGEHERASAELLRAVPSFERSGSQLRAPATLHLLGTWALERGEFALAKRSAETGVELTKVGLSRLVRRWEAFCWDLLGDALVGLGDRVEAQSCYACAHRHFWAFDSTPRRLVPKYRDLGFDLRD